MSLKKKTIIIFASVFSLLLLSQIIVRIYLEIPEYEKLEQINDRKDIIALKQTILSIINETMGFNVDYAHWDDTMYYIVTKNSRYIERNYIQENYRNTGNNGVIIFSNEREVLFARAYSRKTWKQIPDPFLSGRNWNILNTVFIPPEDVEKNSDAATKAGILLIDKQPLIFSNTTITDSTGKSSSYGNLLFWRYLDDEILSRILNQSQLDISFNWSENPQVLEKRFLDNNRNISRQEGNILRDSENKIKAYMNDFLGMPVLEMVIDKHEHLYDNSLFSKNLIAGIIFALISLFFLYYFINNNFLLPVIRIYRHFKTISDTGDYSKRLNSIRNDESRVVADEVDRLFEKIELQNRLLNETNRELELLSNTDGLTQISNRRYLDVCLKKAWEKAASSNIPLSFCICDVDYFKLYNDNYGHLNGDNVLRQVALILKNNLHPATDLVARFGGEEFAIIMEETDSTSAKKVSENLRAAVDKISIVHSHSLCSKNLTISLGTVTFLSCSSADPEMIKEAADRELYKAKNSGRNQWSHSEI